MKSRGFFTLALVATTALIGAPAFAEGDVDAGHKKANTCIGCHGIEGYKNTYPTFRVPRLGGQHGDYVIAALKAYRSGERKHPTMAAQAQSLSDQDIEDIAAYIASLGAK